MSAFQIIAGGLITAFGLGFVFYVAVIVMLPNVIWRPRDPLEEHLSRHAGRPDPSVEDRARRAGQ